MRTMHQVLGGAITSALVAGLVLSACSIGSTASDKVLTGQVCADGTLKCFDGGMGTSSSSGTPPGCVPSTTTGPVADDCGIFVSSSAGMDANAGTKSAPVATLAHAIEIANGSPIYACAESFVGSLEISAGATIYGGLDCLTDWVYIGTTKKSRIDGGVDKPALTVDQSAGGAKIEDFTITAPGATAVGGSSIAMIVDSATVSLDRCDLVAGDATDGAAGDPFPTAAQGGALGLAGGDACSANQVLGGDSASTLCGNPDSISGTGGTGNAASGGNGSDGQPGMTANGGKGEGAAACSSGGAGEAGSAGLPGNGAAGIGALNKAGYSGSSGSPGTSGGPGQGGGGGGGAKGGTGVNQCPVGKAGGAGGGSGGSGGCGGAGGYPGAAGGSSIGVVSLGAMLTLTAVTVTTGNGGKGGDGGPGQDGGPGGLPGTGGKAVAAALKPGCNGGQGGTGGKGGQGGGGQGGHSIGIAFTGTMPDVKDVTFPKKGSFGVGGHGVDMGHDGSAGVQRDTQDFP